MEALGEFTQVLYLDMKAAHEVRQDKRIKMAEKKKAKENATKGTQKRFVQKSRGVRKPLAT